MCTSYTYTIYQQTFPFNPLPHEHESPTMTNLSSHSPQHEPILPITSGPYGTSSSYSFIMAVAKPVDIRKRDVQCPILFIDACVQYRRCWCYFFICFVLACISCEDYGNHRVSSVLVSCLSSFIRDPYFWVCNCNPRCDTRIIMLINIVWYSVSRLKWTVLGQWSRPMSGSKDALQLPCTL
jgi:hypothetical protein